MEPMDQISANDNPSDNPNRSTNPFESICSQSTTSVPLVYSTVPIPLESKKGTSRFNSMTVGDVRQCFQQMRSTPDLRSSTVLWCGITAGQFALAYLLQTAHSSSRRRRFKAKTNT